MITYPLSSIGLEEAIALQFRIVDAVTRHFDGHEVLSLGDLGVGAEINKPVYTQKAERVFAEVFDAQAALFVRGAGTGAIRWALAATLRAGDTIMVHKAPIYPTTKTSLEIMGAHALEADFNSRKDIEETSFKNRSAVKAVLVQHTRQQMGDRYDFAETVRFIKECLPDTPLITDDNYAALKVSAIGCQAGADISTFSCFKILGPEGVGVLIGKGRYIDKVYGMQYSGGSQIQGHEAMEALRGLIYAPVSLAVQSRVGDELARRLNGGEIKGVKNAFIANAQSKVLLIEFEGEIADRFLEIAPRYGAASHPVGCESKYEFAPMMYRVSGTFRQGDPALEKRMIRVNPLRSGPDTIVRIIRSVLGEIIVN
jgi:hypothetical protein